MVTRTAGAGLVFLALAACSSSTATAPPSTRAPMPVSGSALGPLPAVPKRCAQPPPATDQLRAKTVKSAWRREAVDTGTGSLDDLAVGADGAVWATRTTQRKTGTAVQTRFAGLRRWDGTRWQAYPLPDVQVTALGAASSEQAWVFGVAGGQPGLVGAFQHGAWAPLQLTAQSATSIGTAGTATRGSWTVNGTSALRWNGSAWQPSTLPVPAGAVGGEDDGVWTVTGPILPRGPAARWNGTAWQQMGIPALGLPREVYSPRERLADVAVLGPRDIWVVGGVSWLVHGKLDAQGEPLERSRPVALHWNGTAWRCSWGPLGTTFTEAEPDGRGGIWVLDSTASRILHESGGRWTIHKVSGKVTALAQHPATFLAYASGTTAAARPALWRTR